MTADHGGPLAGRVALVTGVTRRIGIAAAVAERLLADGASVLATGWGLHDVEMPWGADPEGGQRLVDSFGGGDRVDHVEADLEDPEVADWLVDATVERFGAVDIVAAVHARSSHESLADVSVEELDRCWAVNTRASLLLARALGRRFDPSRGDRHGRVVLFTSGQHTGPMGDEIAYAVSKGAIREMTLSVADQLADAGITVNCINPGPVDTGYAHGRLHAQVAAMNPAGRWGTPADTARLVAWLVSDEAAWVTGQCIDSTGGWFWGRADRTRAADRER